MKKQFLSILLFSFLMMFSGVNIASAEIEDPVLSVEVNLNSEIEPDTATVKFFVVNSGTNVNEIKTKNDKIVNTAIAEIKKKLNSNESVKTIAYRVNNIYSYKDKIRIFQKYEVTNGFQVKIKDLSKIADIIKIATDNDVKRVDSLNFYVENSEEACNKLMAQAIKTAKNRVNYLAGAAGVQVARLKNINPYCSLNSNYVQQRLYNAMAKSVMADGAASEESAIESIEPGTINFSARVNMSYYLK